MEKVLQPVKKINWKDISKIFPASKEEAEKARLLFISYEKKGYVESGAFSLQHCSKAVIIDFFYRLSLIRSIESPVYRKKKSSWILERDFAYLNHRSIPFIDEYPFFAQLSILPSIRASAIILAPFTSNRKKEINTVDSHSIICNDFQDRDLSDLGISKEDQFHFLIEAIHLLGKCIGYSLDYRVDRFSVPVLRRPDLFRWVDLSSTEPYRDMLTDRSQEIIIEKIRKIVSAHLGSLNSQPNDEDYENLRKKLMSEGLWTVPSCNENSDQLPYYELVENSSLPLFHGGDSNLTSFKFFNSNSSSDSLKPYRSVNNGTLDYYSSLYIKWRDNFSFDFIKFHGIDFADDEKMRKADSPTLDLIKKVIKKTTGKISHTGIIGSLSSNPEQMMISGFNSVFYHDSSFTLDRSFMERNFNLYTYLLDINRKKRKQLSIALHGGDVGSGSDMMLENSCRRLFISRFISCFDGFRPKYEVWDNSLTKRNLSDLPLYNKIEDIYTRYRDILRKGKIIKHYSDEQIAWWIVLHGSNLIIPVVSLDNNEESVPDELVIDYSGIINSSRILSVLDYDFTSSAGNLFLCGDEKIYIEDLVYKKFRLFSVQ
ncbi:MAG: hypothetical protein PF518_18475 [Spirochaetaceae bacterium]|jgi:hypothetical protein|nr:hypothetical protein [Spirochaetaceae bacterium]